MLICAAVFVDVVLVGVVLLAAERGADPLPAESVARPVSVQQVVIEPPGRQPPVAARDIAGDRGNVHPGVVMHVAGRIQAADRIIERLDAGRRVEHRPRHRVVGDVRLRLPQIGIEHFLFNAPDVLKVVTPCKFHQKLFDLVVLVAPLQRPLHHIPGRDHAAADVRRQASDRTAEKVAAAGVSDGIGPICLLQNFRKFSFKHITAGPGRCAARTALFGVRHPAQNKDRSALC